MSYQEWAKNKIKGNIFYLLPAIILSTIIMGLGNGFLFFFVEVGLSYFMVNFITDKKFDVADIFKFTDDFVRCLVVGLVRIILISLWSLLFFIPGIIKSISYSLVPMLLADKKYRNLDVMEVLKKSEEIMNGHKADLFMLTLSFLLWDMLVPFTFGILLIWLIPYEYTAIYKFLYEVKSDYERKNGTFEEVDSERANYCGNCGSKLDSESNFCGNCGKSVN